MVDGVGNDLYNCSFCMKAVNEVEKLIRANDVFICDQCVSTCIEILEDEDLRVAMPTLPISKPEASLETMDEFINRRNKHEAILKQGVNIWNGWRVRNPELRPTLNMADLVEMDLSGGDFHDAAFNAANLSGARLVNCNFVGADFSEADLSNADLSNAQLFNANLSFATLDGTDLNSTDLMFTTFVGARFNNTDFSNSILGLGAFGANDLSLAKGLETVRHFGHSAIDIATLSLSRANIPEVFLRGVGLSDSIITHIPSLIDSEQPIHFYSCFISYSHKDEAFCKQLYSRMRDAGIQVWFAAEDVKGGQKLYEQIQRAIHIHDRLLIVLSENSLRSEWVMTEIRNARKTEIKEKRRKLFPIRLVDMATVQAWECFDPDAGKDLALEMREYFIPDFSNWKDSHEFEDVFDRLLRDLKAEETNQRRA